MLYNKSEKLFIVYFFKLSYHGLSADSFPPTIKWLGGLEKLNEVPEIKYVRTTCPYCGVGCCMNRVVRDGKLVGVAPYQRSPIYEGKLCHILRTSEKTPLNY